ncbi:MAG: hypothetical protein N3G74_01785 [Candidatus Micrarchaeota archaeon]|nr:hypothetical protein [Candidatus Micrarchaeota archaeon]
MGDFVRLIKFSNISVSQLWALTIAARKMPKGFYQPNPISFVKSYEAELFILGKDVEKFSSNLPQSNEAAQQLLKNFVSESHKSYESAKVSLNDLNSLSFSSLSNETLYKVYSIIVSQSSEVARLFFLSKILEATAKDQHSIVQKFISEKSIQFDDIMPTSLSLFKDELFEEIGKRIYKKKQEAALMSPEEFHSALYGGVFDEEELAERKSNYIVVYDLEKDAPHIYSGEKARAMEASLLRRV